MRGKKQILVLILLVFSLSIVALAGAIPVVFSGEGQNIDTQLYESAPSPKEDVGILNGPVCGNTITAFSDGSDSHLVDFPIFGGSNNTTKIRVPMNKYISYFSVNLTGLPVILPGNAALDTVLVNDVSGSMDDNCGPDGIAQPGETPCKINDLVAANKEFIGLVNEEERNRVGLVNYSTTLLDFLPLTDNISLLNDTIDTYSAFGRTCISCGIEKGIEIINEGNNPKKIIILMSDGEANECIDKECNKVMAKNEAKEYAEMAWEQYRIQVYTIAFGNESDMQTMQEIADLGNGYFFYANLTNISETYQALFNTIVVDNITKYPTNPTLDTGLMGATQWQYAGEFNTTEEVTSNIASILTDITENCTCDGCEINGDDCVVALGLTSETAGQILAENLFITYHEKTENICDDGIDNDCDGPIDCADSDCAGKPGPSGTVCCQTAGDCGSEFAIPPIAQCDYDPDNYLATWDTTPGVPGICVENVCEVSEYGEFTHTCNDGDLGDGVVFGGGCNAECDESTDFLTQGNTCYYGCDTDPTSCEYQQSCELGAFCENNVYNYGGDCTYEGCVFEQENCSVYSGWYELPNRWVTLDQCNEKEQNGSEYRNYLCDSASGCTYQSINTTWDDTGNTRPVPNGTTCDDGDLCTVGDQCIEGQCVAQPKNCSNFDLPEIASCTNDPDANPFTWDTASGFTSECVPSTGECTTSTYDYHHECSINFCGAECETDEDCNASECTEEYNDYCEGNKLTEYDSDKIQDSTIVTDSAENTCNTETDCSCSDNPVDCSPPQTNTYCVEGLCGAECDADLDCAPKCVGEVFYENGTCDTADTCACSYETYDCNIDDGYYDTNETRWVEVDICSEKEQKEQANRDYSCGSGGCDYIITGYRWIDTGNERPKEDGTTCDDGDLCTVDDVCIGGTCTGSPKDCSDYDIIGIAQCENDPDANPFTWDFRNEFTSQCLPDTGQCTTGNESIKHICDIEECNAECETDADCPAPHFENDYCAYGQNCQESCECSDGETDYCPEPGTVVNQSLCYYGERACTEEGCSLFVCELENNQFCDPLEGCLDIPCNPYPPITTFHDGETNKTLDFPNGGGSYDTVKVTFPMRYNATFSTIDFTGILSTMSGDNPLDIAIVNDVSGSMDDNCGPDGIAQPGETPCKINDLKNATKEVTELFMSVSDDYEGLVSYSTALVDFTPLTRDEPLLMSKIDQYNAQGFTCISCGIDKGMQIVNEGSNPTKIILLMSDGEANRCIDKTCTPVTAKLEAKEKARQAYEDYGIKVYTVAFGEDADQQTMQEIADLGGGKYYYSPTANLTEVYLTIASEVLMSYPDTPILDIGENNVIDWSHIGAFNSTETVQNFHPALNDLISDCTCDGCNFDPVGNTCTITFEMNSSSAGQLIVDNLKIEGCVYALQGAECNVCSDCGGGADCTDYTEWSSWECEYSDTCDETADCTRSREKTVYTCHNPVTLQAYCSQNTTTEVEMSTETRDTDGTECGDLIDCPEDTCIDGDWYDYPEDGYATCTGGSCGTYSCEATITEDAPECASDADGDGVEDSSDQCPGTPAGEAVTSDGCSCSQKTCDDGNSSTTDSCNEATGECVFIPIECTEYGLTIDTDKDSYMRGEEVIITGELTAPPYCLPVPGKDVAINVRNPYDSIIAAGQIITGSNGEYSFSFTLPVNGLEGMYYTRATSNGFNAIAYFEVSDETCIENWECTEWTPEFCPASGEQTRECTDLNGCGTETNKPNETRECTYMPPKILINEFFSDADTGEEEWIELFNPQDYPVSLDGFTIEDGTHNPYSLDGYSVPANDFLVLERGADHSFFLNNDKDIIILKNGSIEMDKVAYGTYDDGNETDNAPAPGKHESCGRSPDGTDTDIDSNDFVIFGTPSPGEGSIQTVNIQLYKGWNLFSIPFELENWDVAIVLNSIDGKYTQVEQYDNPTDSWNIYLANDPMFSSLTELNNRDGFWINMTEGAVLTITGNEVHGVEIQVYTGQNLIGYPQITSMNVEDALNSIDGKYTQVEQYDNPADSWYAFIAGDPVSSTLAQMEPGFGYKLSATEDAVLKI